MTGELTYRDSFAAQVDSVKVPFEETKEILRKSMSLFYLFCRLFLDWDTDLFITDIGLDPGFKKFYDYCKSKNIPVVLVSSYVFIHSLLCQVIFFKRLNYFFSGMEPIIRAVLSSVLPEEADSIEVIANAVKFTDPSDPKSDWSIIYRHPESKHGHDKSKAILPYKDLPGKRTIFFCGDGLSDLSAAEHADLLFAKEMEDGISDLRAYCKKEGIPNVPFSDL